MIKCFFIDIKSISSTVSISSFDKSRIEKLADAILANDGLIRPLILTATGLEEYTVVVGDLEYYAAVRAKEKNTRKAEMVNAFVIPPNNQQAALDQLKLLAGTQPAAIDRLISVPESKNISISIDQLTTIISQQLQPLQQELTRINRQLAEQQQLLASINSQRLESIALSADNVLATNLTAPEIIEPVAKSSVAVPELTTAKKPGKQTETKPPTKAKTTKKDKAESTDKVLVPTVSSKSTTTKKTTASTKSKPGLDSSIDPVKAASVLNLINTLSPADLQLRMEKSGLTAGTVKFVSSIIDRRNEQPGNKFGSWEIITSEVSGLKAATAKNIITKLK
jgi:hypothetical protein